MAVDAEQHDPRWLFWSLALVGAVRQQKNQDGHGDAPPGQCCAGSSFIFRAAST